MRNVKYVIFNSNMESYAIKKLIEEEIISFVKIDNKCIVGRFGTNKTTLGNILRARNSN